MVELGVSANTRAIIVERQRLLESQTADVRASKRNAALLKDLESLLQTLQRKQHARLAQEARAASAELGGRQRRMREAQAGRRRACGGTGRGALSAERRRSSRSWSSARQRRARSSSCALKSSWSGSTTPRGAPSVWAQVPRSQHPRTRFRCIPRRRRSTCYDMPQLQTFAHTRHANACVPCGRTPWPPPWLELPSRLKRPSSTGGIQIRWISDDLPKMLKLQAEKALHQLGEFQPMDAAAAAEGPPPSGMPAGAADAASALAPGMDPRPSWKRRPALRTAPRLARVCRPPLRHSRPRRAALGARPARARERGRGLSARRRGRPGARKCEHAARAGPLRSLGSSATSGTGPARQSWRGLGAGPSRAVAGCRGGCRQRWGAHRHSTAFW